MSRDRTPNTPIGKCPCPFSGCTITASVYKFRPRTDDTSRQRFAGKLYLVCADHGRSQNQEWILQHATIDQHHRKQQEKTAMGEQKQGPTKKDAPKKDAPKKEPSKEKPDDDGDAGWGFFR